ncbi:ribosomal protein S18-alanine N-acetyltransferase [Mycetocola spongiae]|uniref:ribosomal protein S18-alanine N-acetyltransferase n=1 Tax=Mycetocola spongiae TaxID=2859226 RepID=UPI001CF38D1D|nr:ribosomal protein S18-alanine N-acetyltransferase [Mycetocola spongiae]
MSTPIRPASAADLEAIMAIETAEFLRDAWSPALMAGELASEHTAYFVAGGDTPLDGYAGLFAPAGSPEGDVQTIAVATHARRRGLGRALMGTLINEARGRGVRELFLEVREDNPGARALYLDLGFEELGIRRGYYQPDNVDAVVMRLRITPARETGIGRG